jgi:ribosomal protein S21
MAEIRIHEGESIENALRRFKRKVQQEDIIKDFKRHAFYMKPGCFRQELLVNRPDLIDNVPLSSLFRDWKTDTD